MLTAHQVEQFGADGYLDPCWEEGEEEFCAARVRQIARETSTSMRNRSSMNRASRDYAWIICDSSTAQPARLLLRRSCRHPRLLEAIIAQPSTRCSTVASTRTASKLKARGFSRFCVRAAIPHPSALQPTHYPQG
jgi:hypothetical protein